MPMLKDPAAKYPSFNPPLLDDRRWPSKRIVKAPRWLATDLRDGNQCLEYPMTVEQKWKYFQMLVKVGYKEIDIAFPSASQIEYDFARKLVETPGAVPDDIWLQVLSPCRKDLIRRTVDSITGCKHAILNLYIATSDSFLQTIFNASRQDILEKAVDCIKYARSITKDDPRQSGTTWSLIFSPEAFSDTDVHYSIRICEAAKAAWGPTEDNKIIFNLPATVEMGSPNTYADQVEIFTRSITEPELLCVSLHPHNDRGCAVAAAELGQLAGASRVEGCLFGNGERTGNVDLVTLALNLYVQGIDPMVDFSDLMWVKGVVEECTLIPVHTRAPYSGSSAFLAYSGSHQDAINKASQKAIEEQIWKVPYLPLDPRDVGCSYEAVVQVNSQSGKGGVAWTLRRAINIDLPRGMQIQFSKLIKSLSIKQGGTISSDRIASLFFEMYHLFSPDPNIISFEVGYDGIVRTIEAEVLIHGESLCLKGRGESISSSVVDAISGVYKTQLSFKSSVTTLIHQDVCHKVLLVQSQMGGISNSSWGASVISEAEAGRDIAELKAILSSAIVVLTNSYGIPDMGWESIDYELPKRDNIYSNGVKQVKSYSSPGAPRTLYEKIFDSHVVLEKENGTVLLYIDRHLIHEVTSPQAFESLQSSHLRVRRPDLTLATSDHNVPTTSRKRIEEHTYIRDAESRLQCRTLKRNAKKHNIRYFGLNDVNQGIVHVIGPELGFTQPGLTIVCGDSHTSTHGAFGALAFGIGTTEVEHVLATQTLISTRLKNMKVQVDGDLARGVTSKDIILYTIGVISTAGGTGMVIEFAGSTIESLSMESRMSLCNMSVEAGAKAGLVAPDQTTLDYLKERPLAPQDPEMWSEASSYWSTLVSDPDATFDRIVKIDADDIIPHVTWGTTPEHVQPITGLVPDFSHIADLRKREAHIRALEYMDLTPGTPMQGIMIDKVFIGSCTNARLEDLRAAASIIQGERVAHNIKLALVVPGSGLVKKAAECEGLDQIFKKAGFEWREAGCSLCVGLNEDVLLPSERCASTSNRNFEDRQGAGGRTHLMSPIMAAAAAINGHLIDIRLHGLSKPQLPSTLHTTELFSQEVETDTEEIKKVCGDEAQSENLNISTLSSSELVERKDPLNAIHPNRSFQTWRGRIVPLGLSNVDTDCIIPKQFLKAIGRQGYSKGLFYYLRHTSRSADAEENSNFTLNQPQYHGASILLVTGENFGCGSSREHAVWALQGYGFRCILAPSFGDIFYNNSFKSGLLAVRITSVSLLQELNIEAQAHREITVDLLTQTIYRVADGSIIGAFQVEEHHRQALILGLNEISMSLQAEPDIIRYENRLKLEHPWMHTVSLFGNDDFKKRIASENEVDLSSIEW
ncbi:hypothetical protein B7494_g2398 [Chlorociboria aeruginascens]|nr:hypothetical protein B7494_g2398 [Chlorociboria aeruginascens]